MRPLAMSLSVAICLASPLAAQKQPLELSLLGGYSVQLDNTDRSAWLYPGGSARASLGLSERLSIEAGIRVYRAGEGEVSCGDGFCTALGSYSSVGLQPSLVYHFQPFDSSEGRWYLSLDGAAVRVNTTRGYRYYDDAGVLVGDETVDQSGTQALLGASAGVKVPFGFSGFIRVELAWARTFESGEIPDSDAVLISFGIGGAVD